MIKGVWKKLACGRSGSSQAYASRWPCLLSGRSLTLQPYNHVWLIRAACSWNALASSQGFHKQVASLDAVLLVLQRLASSWVRGLCQALAVVGYHMQLDSVDMQQIDISDLHSCLSAQLACAWDNVESIYACALQRVRACVLKCGCLLIQHTIKKIYCDWPCLVRPWYAFWGSGQVAMLCLMSLVLGIGCLARNDSALKCKALCQSPYSDERHALLECPALTHLREQYQQLFGEHNSMKFPMAE